MRYPRAKNKVLKGAVPCVWRDFVKDFSQQSGAFGSVGLGKPQEAAEPGFSDCAHVCSI